jgi:hypothetical protein
MKVYGMMAKHDGPLTSFYFHAKDQAAANRIAAAHNRYHGYCDMPGSGWQVAVEATDVPSCYIHDEYVSYLRI